MSFKHYSNKVRDIHLDPWVRLAALRSCISRLSFLKGQSNNATLVRLDQKYGFDRYRERNPGQPPNIEQLLVTLEAIEAERKAILDRLRAFNHERIEKKKKGKRNLSMEEREYVKQLRMGSDSDFSKK